MRPQQAGSMALDAGEVVETASARLARLFDAHYDRLYRLARRMSPSSSDAQDLVQEVFLRAARFNTNLPDSPAGEEAWLIRVLVNVSRDDWRRRKVRTRFEKESDFSGTVRSSESAAVAHAEVWHALNQLSPRQRAVIVLKELEDRPIPSIAALLGISRVTVRWHLLAGRRHLAKALGLKETSP